MATRMQQRRGTSAQWNTANPVLAAGEVGLVTDTRQVKFGDGQTPWNQLPGIGYMSLEDVNELPVPNTIPRRSADGTIRAVGANEDNEVVILSQLAPYARYLGEGAAFPTGELTPGDLFQHTGLKCQMRWNGTAWRQVDTAVFADNAEFDVMWTAYQSIIHQGFRITIGGWLYEYEPTIVGGVAPSWVRPNVWVDSMVSTSYAWPIPTTSSPVVWGTAAGNTVGNSFKIFIPKGRALEVAWEIPSLTVGTSANVYLRLASTDGTHGGSFVSTGSVGSNLSSFFSTQILGSGKLYDIYPQAWCATGSASISATPVSGVPVRLKYRFMSDQR